VRTLAEDKGGMRGEHLSLGDAGPLLLVSEASMVQLNAWITADGDLPDTPELDPADLSTGTGASQALDIARFRPNVVIDGEEPFVEDACNWTSERSACVDHLTQREFDRVDLLAL
jgi:uncharacterized protein YcbX